MAVSRYQQRKDYEEAEANAIGTEFLRADLLPPAARETTALQHEMWSVVRSTAVEQPTPVIALATAGMNDVLNSQGFTQSAWWNRIPEGAWALMVAIAISCCGLIGYSARVTRQALLIVLPVILSIAFFFIADIDSPRHGLIRVVPRNLISLSQVLHSARSSS